MKKHTFADKCLCLTLALYVGMLAAGCGKVLQTLQTVLAKAPTVIAIVNTGIDLYNIIDPTGADPALKATIDNAAKTAVTDLNLLVNLVSQYQADIKSAPPGALAQANEYYKLIDQNLAALEAAFGVKSTRAKAEAAAIVDFVDIFLSELASLLPPATVATSAQATATPKTQATIAGKTVKIQDPKKFEKAFNEVSKKNFAQLQVHILTK